MGKGPLLDNRITRQPPLPIPLSRSSATEENEARQVPTGVMCVPSPWRHVFHARLHVVGNCPLCGVRKWYRACLPESIVLVFLVCLLRFQGLGTQVMVCWAPSQYIKVFIFPLSFIFIRDLHPQARYRASPLLSSPLLLLLICFPCRFVINQT